MNNNKMNLLPNSKHFDNNNGKLENRNPKPNTENFPMHIPDEEDNEPDEPNMPEQISKLGLEHNKEEKDIELQEDKKVKKSFFSRFFSRK